ncbi:MAG: hypothetical protein BWY72_02455 [Bacteroidetes bacterium ADurb.Bin416]|nr:MAG: hypothetical protein BWY72_02455 [Bacteroidetes bacterium ADurb.Bin416]
MQGLHFSAKTNQAIDMNSDCLRCFGLIAQSDLPTILDRLACNQSDVSIDRIAT